MNLLAATVVTIQALPARLVEWRVGIVARLGVSFAAVGILAAIANVIVQHGISIVETTRIERDVVPAAIATQEPTPPPVVAPIPAIDTAALALALEQYQRAVVVRAQAGSPDGDPQLAAAEQTLATETTAFVKQIEAEARRSLDRSLAAHREAAHEVLAAADERRSQIREYAAHLDAMHRQIDEAATRGWKILETALVETLVRWRLPDGTLASPDTFLAVAEESGLIVEISDWVVRSAIQTAAAWHHGEWPAARVAVNVSARQLLDQRFVQRFESWLAEFDLPPQCIEIELTETVLQTGPATIDTLHRLRAAGTAVALDDFGTGYSSLASLEQLPFSRIKLDKSLIAGVATSARSAAIAEAIIRLSHGLGLNVTAEGVERLEQVAMLLAHRPVHLQGYLFAKPVALADVIPTLARIAEDAPSLLLAANTLRTEAVPRAVTAAPARTTRRSRARRAT